MSGGRVLGVIPARLGSERLPRKPLHLLAGRPLIEWVWRRVSAMDVLDACVVATDSEEVAAACRTVGADVVLTAASHPSGTDRVAEVAARPEYTDVRVVVNVQGDEPFVAASHVAAAVALVDAGWPVGTVAAPLRETRAYRDSAVVKVVRRPDGAALYFSRSAVPHVRGREPTDDELASARFLRHIGLYAYSPDALRRWVDLEPSGLEELERLEQLRPLEAGIAIGVAVVDGAEGGVDTPEDARVAEERLLRMEPETPTVR
ncbi:MAG TPA: 3-deoxy-manno-octulosonate cytidylyltransferase [Longimicrobiales bacterium]|nr:3-deoxy-manno-octulosonate cytidylyltransferase [Longimicrobiales bacterium]